VPLFRKLKHYFTEATLYKCTNREKIQLIRIFAGHGSWGQFISFMQLPSMVNSDENVIIKAFNTSNTKVILALVDYISDEIFKKVLETGNKNTITKVISASFKEGRYDLINKVTELLSNDQLRLHSAKQFYGCLIAASITESNSENLRRLFSCASASLMKQLMVGENKKLFMQAAFFQGDFRVFSVCFSALKVTHDDIALLIDVPEVVVNKMLQGLSNMIENNPEELLCSF